MNVTSVNLRGLDHAFKGRYFVNGMGQAPWFGSFIQRSSHSISKWASERPRVLTANDSVS